MKEIPLTQGQVALVDDEDYEFLSQYKWHARKHRKTFYAVTAIHNSITGKQVHIKMHQAIIGMRLDQKVIDHINCRGVDNRRENLRHCTFAQNRRNSASYEGVSKYKGVHLVGKKWRARIRINGKSVSLGMFTKEISAAIAYDITAYQYFGEFAKLNFGLYDE
jgi:hypothetical protein